MEIKIIQTADPFNYRKMLEATSRTALRYCELHGLQYESYIGIKRGYYGCHATFNRMFMLTELISRRYDGWVLYMDADAYFYDLSFDLKAYLQQMSERSAIMATIDGQDVPWSINAGVLFFNLGHPNAHALIADWKRRFMAVSNEQLHALTSVWGEINDQAMLFQTLDDSPSLRETVFFEDSRKINHVHGDFIRQYLGCFDEDIHSRTHSLECMVDEVLHEERVGRNIGADTSGLVSAIYRVMLGREADSVGLRDYGRDLEDRGLVAGVEHLLQSLINSEEARTVARHRSGLA